jgi:hypothetical protein
MVDRITPATTGADRAEIRDRFGIEDRWPVICEPFLLPGWPATTRFIPNSRHRRSRDQRRIGDGRTAWLFALRWSTPGLHNEP